MCLWWNKCRHCTTPNLTSNVLKAQLSFTNSCAKIETPSFQVDRSQVDVHVLMAIQLLVEAVTEINKTLLYHIYQLSALRLPHLEQQSLPRQNRCVQSTSLLRAVHTVQLWLQFDYTVTLTDVFTILGVISFSRRPYTILVPHYQRRPEAFPEEVWRPVLPGYHKDILQVRLFSGHHKMYRR